MQPETIAYLANFEDPLTRAIAMASNPYTSTSDLDRLSNHKDMYVRHEVAKNPNTQDYTLEHLSHDEKRFVRMAVACHLNTPFCALEFMLENDEDQHVKCDAKYFLNKRLNEMARATGQMRAEKWTKNTFPPADDQADALFDKLIKEFKNKKPTKP